MIREVAEHIETTFDHVLHGKSTSLEKLEVGAEILGAIGTAAIAARFGIGRSGLLKAEANDLLPAFEVNVSKTSADVIEKSSSIIDSSNGFVKTESSPYYSLAPELANTLRPVLSGKHDDFESFLFSSQEAIAKINRSQLPELPELIIGAKPPDLTKASYSFGIARLTAPHGSSLNEFRVQDLFDTGERKDAEGLMSDYISHEATHHEQLVSVIRRIADKLGVGKVATDEELIAISAQRRGSEIVGVLPRSEKAFVERVVGVRDGQPLDAAQASRADNLIKSFQNHGPVAKRWNQIKTNLADARKSFREGQDVANPGADSAAYFGELSRMRNLELRTGSEYVPRFLQGAIDRSIAMQVSHPEIGAEQLGASLGRQHSARINMLEAQDKLLGIRRYKSLLHEQEAYSVGDAVRAAYENP